MVRINIGCGQTPTTGWDNLDNSPSIRLATFPVLVSLLKALGILNRHQLQFIEFARSSNIKWVNAVKKIPYINNSVDVIYTSHMVEHLDQHEVVAFLSEVRRVLKRDGIIRIAVPDMRKIVQDYLEHQDANKLVSDTYLAVPKPRSVVSRFSNVLFGARHHHWMYDEDSLIRLLHDNGFHSAVSLKPGDTAIADSGSLNLREREDASIYVEARKI